MPCATPSAHSSDCCAGATVWLWNREPVPGTSRSHSILLPVGYEEMLGKQAIEEVQKKMVRAFLFFFFFQVLLHLYRN